MVIWAVKFVKEGYKIRHIFGQKNQHIQRKLHNITFKVNFQCQGPWRPILPYYKHGKSHCFKRDRVNSELFFEYN